MTRPPGTNDLLPALGERLASSRRPVAWVLGLVVAVAISVAGAVPAGAATTSTVTIHATTVGGVPIRSMDFNLEPNGDQTASSLHGVTDVDGDVQLQDVPSGSYRLSGILDLGSRDATVYSSLDVDGDVTVPVTVAGAQAITGTITDAASHQPVAGAVVDATATEYTGEYLNGDTTFTTSTGAYVLIVPPGAYRVSAGKTPPYASPVYYRTAGGTLSAVTVAWDKDRTGIDLALAKDSTVTVKVTGHGKAVGGATVALPPVSSGKTGATGVYSTKVQPGSFTARVTTPTSRGYLTTYSGGTVREPDARSFSTKAGAATSLHVALVAAATITGKVVTSSGKPVSHVAVTAANVGRSGSATAQTDAKGRYTLHGLATGKVHLTFKHVDRKISSITVTAKQGSKVTAKTRIATWNPWPPLTGKVTGRGVDGLGVVLLSSTHHVVADAVANGEKVAFAKVPPGTYRLVVIGTNLSKKVTVKAGKKASFGTISRGTLHTVSGVVRSASGAVVVGASVTITDAYGTRAVSTSTDEHGRFSALGVLTGTYTVSARSRSTADGTGTTTFSVTRGKDRTGVTVRLPRGATLQGVVKSASGKVVAGVVVRADKRSATTDRHGHWVLRGVTPGTRTVTFTDPYTGGYKSTSRSAKAKSGSTTTLKTVHVS